jgi:hypothetical protein
MNHLYRNACALLLLFAVLATVPIEALDWNDNKSWNTNDNDGKNKLDLINIGFNDGIKAEFNLSSAPEDNWVIMQLEPDGFDPEKAVVFDIKANASCDLEIKFLDKENTTYRRIISMKDKFRNWTRVVVYLKHLDYAWNDERDSYHRFGEFKNFELAFSGVNGNGEVLLNFTGFEKRDGKLLLDPDAALRRDEKLNSENQHVLEWLKVVQDNASRDGILLPSGGLDDNRTSTYDNAIVAMAFILKDEPKRAKKILDFYANAAKPDNEDPKRQSFFYKGEPRGFFQYAVIRDERNTTYYDGNNSDRWMGDMCWLMLAYKYYDKKYGNQEYGRIECLMKGLLLSWYNATGGYIGSGWRKNDTQVDSHLHEKDGHQEGNIDAYAVMNLYGEPEIANIYIKKWLDDKLGYRHGHPLDVYTLRSLSGAAGGSILHYPDEEPSYQKTLNFNGKQVKGVWHAFDENENNIWTQGVGQLACAFYEAGDREKGNFYANQMDSYLIIDDKQDTVLTGYLINGDEAISSAAWYIFAKNQFNPMKLNSTR